jgi:hypothetical protein
MYHPLDLTILLCLSLFNTLLQVNPSALLGARATSKKLSTSEYAIQAVSFEARETIRFYNKADFIGQMDEKFSGRSTRIGFSSVQDVDNAIVSGWLAVVLPNIFSFCLFLTSL